MARPASGYTNEAGERIPGVTTILGVIAKPALIGWAGKTCTEAAWRAGKAGEPMPKWGDVLYGRRDKAASDGTRAHELFERHLRGESIERGPEDTDGAWQAFENAKQWLEGVGAEVEVWPHERPLVVQSRELSFGGTPDALLKIADGRVWLADWKTGTGVYPEQIAQLAAYRFLLELDAEVSISGAHLVRFHREHAAFTHTMLGLDALDFGWQVFLYAYHLHHALADIKPYT